MPSTAEHLGHLRHVQSPIAPAQAELDGICADALVVPCHTERSVVLDLTTDEGRQHLDRMLENVDAVLETSPDSYQQGHGIDYASLSARNPRVVLTSISPFGATGPYRDFQGADIVINAVGGLVHAEGEPHSAPLNPPRYQAYQMGGLHAAFGTLIALWERETSGIGQHVEVSLQEVAAHQHMAIVRYASGQEISARRPNRGSTGPSQYYRTKDGWVMLALTSGRQWVEFATWTGDPILMEKSYEILANRDVHYDVIDEKCAAFVAHFTTEEFLREGSARRVTVAPANTPAAFMDDAHALARGYFGEVEHPTLGRYVTPGAGADYSATPWAVRRPAPTLGQHTAEVLGELGSGQSPRDQERSVSIAGGSDDAKASGLPLEGVRILAFSRVWAAPFGTRFLADYGAEVIKVESTQFPDGRLWDVNTNPAAWRMGHATFGEINRNKKSVSLDLHSPAGQDIFKRLAAEADVVVENNAPNAMARFGVDYDALRAVKPDIIMVSCPGYGSHGPMRDYVAVGQCLTAYTGLGNLWGNPGSEWPLRGKNAYPDFITSGNLALAVMAALHHRRKTGEGQRIELAQFQAAASMIGLSFLESSLGDGDPQPWGNRDPNAAPQGVYPCKGTDRWCAISCPDDATWRSLATLMGQRPAAADPRFATTDGRHDNHDALDGLIAQWTSTLTPHQAMLRCQLAGIPAGIVANGEDLYHDQQLRARGYIVEIDHPYPGRVQHPGMTVRFSRTPGRVRRSAPTPGQHNAEVLSTILGLSEAEIEKYTSEGALS